MRSTPSNGGCGGTGKRTSPPVSRRARGERAWTSRSWRPAKPLLVDHDRSAAERGGRDRRVRGAEHVVVHDGAGRLVVDLDAELVDPAATADLAVGRGEDEAVAAHAVHHARALVLGLRAGDDEPVVRGAVEVEAGGLELELRVTGRDRAVLRVLRDEAEARLPGEGRVRVVRAGGRGDPAATGHEAGGRVVDREDDAVGRAGVVVLVGAADADLLHVGRA